MAGTAHPRRLARRLERWLLGIAMTIAAWIIERRLLKVIRQGGSVLPADASRASGRLSVTRPTDDEA
jgi:hypothetical protein